MRFFTYSHPYYVIPVKTGIQARILFCHSGLAVPAPGGIRNPDPHFNFTNLITL